MKTNSARKVHSKGASDEHATKSYRLYEVFRKQHGKATVTQLAAAIKEPGKKAEPETVSYYMGELKRVYGVDFTHERGSPTYQVSNLTIKVPINGSRGRMRWQRRNRGVRVSRQLLAASAGGTPPNGFTAELDKITKEIEQQLHAFREKVKMHLIQGQPSVTIPASIFDKLKATGRVSKQDLTLIGTH